MQAATAASHMSFLHASPVGEAWLGAARWQAKAQNKAAAPNFILIPCKKSLGSWKQVLGDASAALRS
jgi:hypothetical protein